MQDRRWSEGLVSSKNVSQDQAFLCLSLASPAGQKVVAWMLAATDWMSAASPQVSWKVIGGACQQFLSIPPAVLYCFQWAASQEVSWKAIQLAFQQLECKLHICMQAKSMSGAFTANIYLKAKRWGNRRHTAFFFWKDQSLYFQYCTDIKVENSFTLPSEVKLCLNLNQPSSGWTMGLVKKWPKMYILQPK